MSELDIHHPHDGLVRIIFGATGNAVSLLQSYLPAKLSKRVDWDAVALESGEFVGDEFQRASCDLLYLLPLLDAAPPIFIHLLVEHQRTGKDVRERIVIYKGYTLQRLRKQNGENAPTPLVLPMLIAQVPGGWPFSTQYADAVQWPEGLRPELECYEMRFEHILLDLARVRHEALKGNVEVRLTLGLLKAAMERDFHSWLEYGIDELEQVNPQRLRTFFLYVASTGETEDLKRVKERVSSEKTPKTKEAFMTAAEALIAEGRAEGEALGEARGVARGRAEGEARGAVIGQIQILKQMLGRPDEPIENYAGISAERLAAMASALKQELLSRS